MADIDTTFTLAPEIFPFSGVPTESSGIPVPLREYRFTLLAGAIALTGVGENQNVVAAMTLPTAYAYSMQDLHVQLVPVDVADANNMPQSCLGTFRDGGTTRVHMELHNKAMVIGGGGAQQRVYAPVDMPKVVLLPGTPDDSVSFLVLVYNTTANTHAYTMGVYARFLQYTLDQARHWAVNTPSPVLV